LGEAERLGNVSEACQRLEQCGPDGVHPSDARDDFRDVAIVVTGVSDAREVLVANIPAPLDDRSRKLKGGGLGSEARASRDAMS
jgi:hypothetical protein